jgi:hypothetical protein
MVAMKSTSERGKP